MPAIWYNRGVTPATYLDWLVSEVGKALEDWQDISDTVDALAEAPAFRHLKFYDGWHRTNINRAYLQLEAARG